MKQQHIDNDTLSTFVKISSLAAETTLDDNVMDNALYHDVLDHLAGCVDCRQQVAAITTLNNDWPDIVQQSDLTEDQQQMICDYIDGNLNDEETATAKKLIELNPEALKAALHYQCNVETMRQHISTDENTQLETKNQLHLPPLQSNINHTQGGMFAAIPNILTRIFSLQSPAVYTVAITAALFVAVLTLLQTPEIQQQKTVIASYQDNTVIRFTDKSKLPGIGFFTQSGNTSAPFEDINIELISDSSIKISWPSIDGAERYKMRIQVFNQGKKTTLQETETQDNHVIFQLEPVKPGVNAGASSAEAIQQQAVHKIPHNKRYEWVLYGNTIEDRMFYASGGFIINKGN